MPTYSHREPQNENQRVPDITSGGSKVNGAARELLNKRPEAIVQQKLRGITNGYALGQQAMQLRAMAHEYADNLRLTLQRKENHTGLPDSLKAGIESLSGYSMDDVKVHYNSDKPAQLHAHAYAQGTDIHLATGQDKHLPHEAWHVVQQKQGRVRPNANVNGIGVNTNPSLEKEADQKGRQASLTPGSLGQKPGDMMAHQEGVPV